MRNIIFIMSLVLFFGCSNLMQTYKVQYDKQQKEVIDKKYMQKIVVNDNKFSDMKTTSFYGSDLIFDERGDHGSFVLNRIENLKTNHVFYFITFTYSSSSWLFVQKGDSLVFLLNGKDKITLNSIEGSLGNRNIQDNYFKKLAEESANYFLSQDLIKRIFSSETIDFQVKGNNRYVSGKFLTESILEFKRFASEYIKE